MDKNTEEALAALIVFVFLAAFPFIILVITVGVILWLVKWIIL